MVHMFTHNGVFKYAVDVMMVDKINETMLSVLLFFIVYFESINDASHYYIPRFPDLNNVMYFTLIGLENSSQYY